MGEVVPPFDPFLETSIKGQLLLSFSSQQVSSSIREQHIHTDPSGRRRISLFPSLTHEIYSQCELNICSTLFSSLSTERMFHDGYLIGDGSWELRIFVTDLRVEHTLRVKGDLHVGGLMFKLVEDLGEFCFTSLIFHL